MFQAPEREAGRNRLATSPLLWVLIGLVIPALLVYGFAVANELQVFGIAAAVIGLVVILARPFAGLALFVALLYTRPEESIKALAGMHFTLVIALVTFLGMWIHLFLNRERFMRTPLNWMIVGFGCAAFLSSLGHGDSSPALMDFSRLVILMLLVVNLAKTPAHYRSLVTAMLLFTAYLAGYSIYLFFSGGTVMDEGVLRSKATGIFSDPNDLAATFVAGLALTLSRVIQSEKWGRLCYALIAALMVWAIFMTSSRGGLLGLLAVVGGFFFVYQKNKSVAFVLAGFVGVILLVATPGRMTNFDSQESSANSRFVFWDNGIKQLISHPLVGVGYNQFADVNGGFVAHNSFVQCFAETGLLGYFFWLGCIYFCFRRFRPGAAGAERGVSRDLLGARLALAGYLTACFWITRTYSPVLYLLMTLPICQQLSAAGSGDVFTRAFPERARDWGRIALLCAGSIFFIFCLVLRLK